MTITLYTTEELRVRDAAPDLLEALQKAVATFDDLARVLRLLGRGTLADACMVAADGSRDALAKAVQS